MIRRSHSRSVLLRRSNSQLRKSSFLTLARNKECNNVHARSHQRRSAGKAYAGRKFVDGVSFSVPRGEVIGFLGPNGAGKSTVIECIAGLWEPDSGSIQILGMTPGENRTAFAERVTIQPQAASLFGSLNVDETLRIFRSFHRAGMDPRTVRDDVGLAEQNRTRVKHLSGWQLRRLLLAVALVCDPDVVLLDEPSAGLDPAARQQLWATIRRLTADGKTVMLFTYHMEEATNLCDRGGILVAGKLLALDTPKNFPLARDAKTTGSFTIERDVDLTPLSNSQRL